MKDDDLPTKRVKQPRLLRAIAWSIGLSAIAGVLAYYALQLWADDLRKSERLTVVNTQMATLKREHAVQQKQVEALEHKDAEQRERLVQNDAELMTAKEKLAAAESRLGELESERQALSARVEEFHRVTQQFQRMIDSGKLSVNFRNGRMIVELPDAVLFASGSADLSADGQAALKEVAEILREVPGKRFVVGGHTDDVPIAKPQSSFSSNWALSAARAVVVTEALVAAGINSTSLVAAGYGPYDPIATNTSSKGRQKNRRIEIVLDPDLRELPGTLKAVAKKEN